ncbi:unnamed protein product [Brassica napus]|uniref:(rape) hypothetical protein n=1 Tax=Brassica napus TaxID=3708 RepID=A0A816JWY7_BRANA|nr:unnamed protein product [Brassica napus]
MDGATFSATNVQESYSEDSLHSHALLAASVADPLESEGTGSGDVQLNPTCPLTTTTGAEEHTGVGSSAEEPHVSSAERELKKAHKA